MGPLVTELFVDSRVENSRTTMPKKQRRQKRPNASRFSRKSKQSTERHQNFELNEYCESRGKAKLSEKYDCKDMATMEMEFCKLKDLMRIEYNSYFQILRRDIASYFHLIKEFLEIHHIKQDLVRIQCIDIAVICAGLISMLDYSKLSEIRIKTKFMKQIERLAKIACKSYEFHQALFVFSLLARYYYLDVYDSKKAIKCVKKQLKLAYISNDKYTMSRVLWKSFKWEYRIQNYKQCKKLIHIGNKYNCGEFLTNLKQFDTSILDQETNFDANDAERHKRLIQRT